jgi:hypothetical protein
MALVAHPLQLPLCLEGRTKFVYSLLCPFFIEAHHVMAQTEAAAFWQGAAGSRGQGPSLVSSRVEGHWRRCFVPGPRCLSISVSVGECSLSCIAGSSGGVARRWAASLALPCTSHEFGLPPPNKSWKQHEHDVLDTANKASRTRLRNSVDLDLSVSNFS